MGEYGSRTPLAQVAMAAPMLKNMKLAKIEKQETETAFVFLDARADVGEAISSFREPNLAAEDVQDYRNSERI